MKKHIALSGAALSVSSLILGGCGFVKTPPFEPRQLEQIQKERAAETPLPDFRPLPTTLQGTGGPATRPARIVPPLGPTVRMTLQEIIHRTVANNLDTRVAAYEAAVDEARILEAEARFDPTLFSNVQAQRQFPQSIQPILTPGQIDTQQGAIGIRQILPSGAQVELRAQSTRTDVRNPSGGFPPPTNPLNQTELVAQITQPLLRDFGAEVNRARIVIARNDQRITQLDWRSRLEEVLTEVESSYWQLAQAQRDLEVLQNLLRQTEDTLDILRKRERQDVARLQISQANATVEARRAELVRAQQRISDQSDRIKRLMNDPDLPVVDPRVILPADAPTEDPVQFALADQIETALQNRADLLQQKVRIESADVVVGAAKNNIFPKLDFTGQLGLAGTGKDVDEAVDRGNMDLFTWQVGLAFEVPIGNRAARAIYQRTLLARQQSLEEYRRLVEVAALEVKTAFRDVETSWNEIIATRHARFAAEDALSAIEQRERASEPLTPTFVQLKLDRQESLARTQRAEIEAVVRYNVAISTLERAKGTLLRYNNVVMKEESYVQTMRKISR